MKTLHIVAVCLLAVAPHAHAQQSRVPLLAQAVRIAAQHAANVAAQQVRVHVELSEVRVDTRIERDLQEVSLAARELGAKVANRKAVVRCESLNCETTDGSKVGLSLGEIQVDGNRAKVPVEVWVVWTSVARTQLYGQWDVLHLERSGGRWVLNHVESSGRT